MGSDYRKPKTRDGNYFIHLGPEGAIGGFEQRDDMVEAVLKEEQSSSSVQVVLQSAKSRRPTRSLLQ